MNAVINEAERSAGSLMAASAAGGGIDRAKFFIPEEFTPLFHTGLYGSLPATVRLRYNQLHALYFNEQVAFFEQEMLSPALRALSGEALPERLLAGLRIFHEEEQRHTAGFRSLNSQCEPALYASHSYFFISVARPARAALAAISRRPRFFPLLLWLALMQEERSLFYSRGCLAKAASLEPHFVAMHRAHLADEVGHVGWDEELLDWLWPRVGLLLRSFNVRLLNWMIGEFFLLPKRSGLRVVELLALEFPELGGASLFKAMAALKDNAAYLRTLYSREITPRTFRRFDAHPEFALLAKTLPGYLPAGSSR